MGGSYRLTDQRQLEDRWSTTNA